MKKALRPAFTATIPVLCGYLFIGFAFGVMLRDIGFGSIWSFFCSLSIYAGSGQYLLVSLLAARASLVTVAVMTLLLNCRHIFYGLSFLETFHAMGRRKWYMIFSLTDETYSLLCSVKTPEGIDAGDMRFWIAMLDHSYWILGSVLGTIIGGILPFDTTGIDFAIHGYLRGAVAEHQVPHSRTDGAGCGSCVARHPRAGQFHPARHARNLRHAGRYARPSGKGGRLIMTTVYAIAMIAVAAVCTFATRVAPFLLFNGSKPIPPIIRYLGSTLPPAVIALLVVYCLKNVGWVRMVFPSCCASPSRRCCTSGSIITCCLSASARCFTWCWCKMCSFNPYAGADRCVRPFPIAVYRALLLFSITLQKAVDNSRFACYYI